VGSSRSQKMEGKNEEIEDSPALRMTVAGKQNK
jgi:hypothetical protein